MYQIKRTFVKDDSKLTLLIFENPMLLLVLEHFNIKFPIHDYTVRQFCEQNDIDPQLFILLSNVYNGFYQDLHNQLKFNDIPEIIQFLRRSHLYYKNDKYPEIRSLIGQLSACNPSPEIGLVEQYFNEYLTEVIEHLDYEDQTAFPYFEAMYQKYLHKNQILPIFAFSVKEYSDHHTDIQSRLNELKNLLLKHIAIKDDLSIRRKLLLNLFEVEYDLNAHSLIESNVLSPLVDMIELNLSK